MKPYALKLPVSAAISLIALLLTASCKKTQNGPSVLVFAASGDVSEKLTAFREQLGGLNTTTGQTKGRREINWDGVPDNLTGIKLPADFFNPTAAGSPEARQRGLVYAGNELAMVSKTGFAEINPLAAPEFKNFSGNKSFAVVNAGSWPVEFRVAGQNAIATVKGFGVIFSDVDKAYSAYIEFFNGTQTLGKYYVPAQTGTSGFSFLGVYFPGDVISRVVVTHEGMLQQGEKDISQGGNNDLVALDDFIYSEPVKQ